MLPDDRLIRLLEDPDDPDAVITAADYYWVICGRCKGDGTLRGYPGAYTQDEFYEAFGDDPDEYLGHVRTCEDCGGDGKCRELTAEALARPEVAAEIKDYYDTEAMSRQERAMGA